jgi:Protein of unknown function (DUF2971)
MKKFSWLFSRARSSFPSEDFRSSDYSGHWQKQFINHYLDEGFLHGFDKATAKFSDYKDEHLPKSLYKFFPPTIYSLVSLENRTLYLATTNDFNDPFDSYVGIERLTYIKTYVLKELKRRELIASVATNDQLSEEEYWKLFYSHSKDEDVGFLSERKQFIGEWFRIIHQKSHDFYMIVNGLWCDAHRECTEKISDIRNAPFRITCFSNFADDEELGKNTTMWSHYADNHRGFCVKYSLNFSDSPNQSIIKCGLYKVMYSSRISKASPREVMKLKYDDNYELKVNAYLAKTIYRALITKAKFWNYEKEWRLILGKENFDILNDGSISFPFIEAVYLGCKMESALQQHIVRFAHANNIPVYLAGKSSEKFNLDFTIQNGKDRGQLLTLDKDASL